MNHLPLRQWVEVTDDAERVFARQDLLDALSRPGRFQVVRHGAGGLLLAVRELGLAEGRVALRQAYGERVRFGPVTVHAEADPATGGWLLPVMFLRIDVPRAHRHALLDLLRERGIGTQDVDVRRDRAVVRAEAPLPRLLGLERRVGELTDGSAHTMCWLLRYAAADRATEPATAQA